LTKIVYKSMPLTKKISLSILIIGYLLQASIILYILPVTFILFHIYPLSQINEYFGRGFEMLFALMLISQKAGP
jgi:hypothetical protein